MKNIIDELNELIEDIEDDVCGNWNKSVDARITSRLAEIVKNLALIIAIDNNFNTKS